MLKFRNFEDPDYIGACAPEETSELGKTGESSQTIVIGGASASTVVGMRPTFIHMGGLTDEDYSVGMSDSLWGVLKLKTPPREHVVILCGEGISVEKVSQTATELRYTVQQPFTLNPTMRSTNS